MCPKGQEKLKQLAEAKAELSSTDATSHLKKIKHRELMANDYAVVQKVTNTVTKKQGEEESLYSEWNMRTPMKPCSNRWK